MKIQNALKVTLNYCELRVAFKIQSRLSYLLHSKGRIPNDLAYGVNFPCKRLSRYNEINTACQKKILLHVSFYKQPQFLGQTLSY